MNKTNTLTATTAKKEKEQQTMKLQLLLSDLKEVNKELKKTWINTKHIPVMNEIKIEVKNSIAYFSISSESISASYKIKALDTIDGAATISYVEFDKLVRKLKNDYVTIELDKYQMQTTLKTDKNEFKFDNLINQYPHPRERSKPELVRYLSVNFKELKDTLQQPLKVVSKLDSRPILTGVNFIVGKDLLTAVATDSHRLARNKMKILNDYEYNFVLPGFELEKMLRLNFDDSINIEVHNDFVRFDDRKLEIEIRRLEGNYPATDKLIPEFFNATFKVDRKELLNDLELSKILIDKTKDNFINMAATNESIIVENQKAGVKNTLLPIDYTNEANEEVNFYFNPNYMIETLKQLSSNQVEIKFVSRLRPFIVNDPNNETLDNLITPIRRGV